MAEAKENQSVPGEQPPAPTTGAEATRTVGRGFLFILSAKVYFLFTGFIVQFGLPRLFLRGARAMVEAGGQAGVSAARLAEGLYGDYGVATRTVSWINNTMVQGTIQSVSKYVAEDEHRAEAVRNAALRVQAVLGSVLAAGYFLGADLMASWLADARLAGYFRITAIIILAYALYAVFIGYLNGRKRFRAQATFDISFSTLKTGSILLLALLGYGVGPVLGAFSGAAVAICVAAVAIVGLRRPDPTITFPWRLLLRGMALVVAYYVIFNFLLTADILVLKALAGRSAARAAADALITVSAGLVSSSLVGIYNGVLNLALLPYQTILAIAFVAFPLISRSTFTQDQLATRRYIETTLRYSLLFVGCVAVALSVFPQALLRLLNPSFEVGAPALRIYIGGEVFFALFAIANTIIIASGRTGVAILLAAATLALDVGANLLVVPRFLHLAGDGFDPIALVAAAGSTAPVFALGFLAAAFYLWRAFGARPRLLTLARVTGCAGIIVGGATLLPPLPLIPMLLLAPVAALLYLLGLLLSREVGRADLAGLLTVLSRRKAG